jgi:hypothetical protein
MRYGAHGVLFGANEKTSKGLKPGNLRTEGFRGSENLQPQTIAATKYAGEGIGRAEIRAESGKDGEFSAGVHRGTSNCAKPEVITARNGVELSRIQARSSVQAVSVKPSFRNSNRFTWRIYESPPNNPCSRVILRQTADLWPSQTTPNATPAHSCPGTVADQEARPIRTGIRKCGSDATFGVQLLTSPHQPQTSSGTTKGAR